MSDLAPNISGNRSMDQPRSMALLDDALAFAEAVLKPGGDFLAKAFQGEGVESFTRGLRERFRDGQDDQSRKRRDLRVARFIC